MLVQLLALGLVMQAFTTVRSELRVDTELARPGMLLAPLYVPALGIIDYRYKIPYSQSSAKLPVIWSSGHPVFQYSRQAIQSSGNLVIVSLCHHVIRHHVIRHPVIWSSCHLVIVSFGHPVFLITQIFDKLTNGQTTDLQVCFADYKERCHRNVVDDSY